MKNEKPILFSGEMVRAILDGRKTQTRRLVKPQPIFEDVESFGDSWKWSKGDDWFSGATTKQLTGSTGLLYPARSVYGIAGDCLWVKETFSAHGAFGTGGHVFYRADISSGKEPHGLHWKPSIFCPRKASRLTLEIVKVRVERLQDISEADCYAEGITNPPADGAFPHTHGVVAAVEYRALWESINGKGSWTLNPWVWCITFKRF